MTGYQVNRVNKPGLLTLQAGSLDAIRPPGREVARLIEPELPPDPRELIPTVPLNLQQGVDVNGSRALRSLGKTLSNNRLPGLFRAVQSF